MHIDPSNQPTSDDRTQRANGERFARRLTRDVHAADDAVQNAWMKILDAPGRSIQSMSAYLRAVIRREYLRSRRIQIQRLRRERLVARPEATSSFVGSIEREQSRKEIRRAVDDLAEPYRSVVRMRYIEGLDYSEIAKRLGRPATTIRTQVQRGLDTLRPQLAKRDLFHGALPYFLLLLSRIRMPRVASIAALGAGACVLAVMLLEPTYSAQRTTDAHALASAPSVTPDDSIIPNPIRSDAVPARRKASETASLAQLASTRSDALRPPGVNLEGTVLTPDGTPRSNASIFVDAHAKRTPNNPPDREPETVTDSNGHFTLNGLDRDAWIWAESASFVASARHQVWSIPHGARGDIELALVNGSETHFRVTDADDSPVANAAVTVGETGRLRWGNDGTIQIQVQRTAAVTDENGLATVTMTRPFARKEFAVVAPGFAPAFGATRNVPREVVVQLTRGCVVAGRATDPEGNALVGAVVRIASSLRELDDTSQPATRSKTTDESGAFRFDATPPGAFCISAEYANGKRTLSSAPIEGVANPGSGVDLVIECSDAWTLSGRVATDDADAAHYFITTSAAGVNAAPLADDGRFALCRIWAPGSLRILREYDGGFLTVARANFEPGQAQLEVEVPELRGRARGTIDADGAGAQLQLRIANIGKLRVPIDPMSGAWSVEGVPTGSYDATLLVPGVGSGSVGTVDVLDRETWPARLESPQPCALAIEFDWDTIEYPLVMWSLSSPRTGSPEVTRQSRPGDPFADVVRNPSGGFSIDGLNPGTYRVDARASGRTFTSAEIDVVPGDNVVRLDSAAGAFLNVQVIAPRPLLSGETLRLTRSANGVEKVLVDGIPEFASPAAVVSIRRFFPATELVFEASTSEGLLGSAVLLATDVDEERSLQIVLR